jgi:undecaprenyl-diphosphatase
MSHWLRKAKEFLSKREPLVLFSALILLLALWGLFALTDEVLEGDTQSLDLRIMNALRQPGPGQGAKPIPIGPRWLKSAMLDITALGGVAVLTLLVGGVIGFLIMIRHYHMMWLVLLASAGAALVNTSVKALIDRPRPPMDLRLTEVSTPSFPSGHSTLSAAVYLTLGTLLAQTVKKKRAKAYFIGVALLLTMLVGFSRVFLGVHFPSDVLAGWTSGIIWAILIWLLGRHLQRKGAIEQETELIESPPAPEPALDPKL